MSTVLSNISTEVLARAYNLQKSIETQQAELNELLGLPTNHQATEAPVAEETQAPSKRRFTDKSRLAISKAQKARWAEVRRVKQEKEAAKAAKKAGKSIGSQIPAAPVSVPPPVPVSAKAA